MQLIQLLYPLAMRVVGGIVDGQEYIGPTGNCMAIGWHKNLPDDHITWIVIFDDTGRVWEIENPYIRARANLTWGRNKPEKE